ncbi:hypothetical protein [Acidithiobacillus sp.]|uniref:hypothetical protein n=1 Tax=Acidithiobacillus sp. TaxID=1872118 RepID=UPI002611F1CA|nr:hypothetical protein [Acidithiobacillus sp.]MDD5278631.1 hypothetical protein [Acidithiobacillus sp.]
MSKKQTRIQSADMQAISNIATQKGLKLSTVLDAVIQAGLTEIQSDQRYELLPTGILLVRDGGQDAPSASRRNQRAPTARPKPAENRAKARGRAQSNTDSPQTATASKTQPSVAQSTQQPAQRASEATTSPQTATTVQAQPQVTQSTSHPAQRAPEPAASPQTVETNTPVPPFLTGDMIPLDIYDDLTDYEKECLSHEAFLLSPDGQVVLRDEPPIASDGTRGNLTGWRTLCAGFIPGDDFDNFIGLTWKIKDK